MIYPFNSGNFNDKSTKKNRFNIINLMQKIANKKDSKEIEEEEKKDEEEEEVKIEKKK